MTTRTAAGAVEIRLARVRVSRSHVGHVDAAAAARQFGLLLLIVNERNDRHEIVVRQAEGRHPLVDASVADDRNELVAADVVDDERRPREIRSAFAARRITAVAEAAPRREELLSHLDL